MAAIRSAKRAEEPADVFSLALIATTNMGTPHIGTVDIWNSYVDDNRYTACHDVGAALVGILGTGGLIATGMGAAGLAVAAANFGVHRALKIDYGLHTFTLVNHAGNVECIEAWADKEQPLTVGTCIFDDELVDQINLTAAAAQLAFPGLLSAAQATRTASLGALSRARFRPNNAVPTLMVTAYPLDTPANIRAKYRARVDIAKEWARDAREHVRDRYTCSECLTPHGWFSSWVRTWAKCPDVMCAKVYCHKCKAYQPTALFNGVSNRMCRCGQFLNDIAMDEIRP
jgi:hypothetical protein